MKPIHNVTCAIVYVVWPNVYHIDAVAYCGMTDVSQPRKYSCYFFCNCWWQQV